MAEQIHRFSVGDFACISIQDTESTVTAAQFFPNVPEQERDSTFRAQGFDPDALAISYNCVLVNTGESQVLIDAGFSPAMNPDSRILANLKSMGVEPEDIPIVVLSQLHGDHYAGLTDGAGNIIYRNAEIIVWKKEWEHWASESLIASYEKEEPERAQFYRDYLLPLEPQVKLITEEVTVVPGIRIVYAPGHSPHHLAIAIESGGESLLFIGDAYVHTLQISHPEWAFAADHDPAQATETRKMLARMAVDENMLVHGFHFPFPGLGYIRPDGESWTWEPQEG